jgi:hypothetical protein
MAKNEECRNRPANLNDPYVPEETFLFRSTIAREARLHC